MDGLVRSDDVLVAVVNETLPRLQALRSDFAHVTAAHVEIVQALGDGEVLVTKTVLRDSNGDISGVIERRPVA